MQTFNTETPTEYANLSRQDVLRIEPLVVHPVKLAQLLVKLDSNQRPVSVLELHRLGVPRFVTRWLLGFANDTVTEAELVRAFVLHLVSRHGARKTPYDLFKRFLPQSTVVLNDPNLTMDERLVLHSLNILAGPLTDSWFDLIDPDTQASRIEIMN